MYSRCHLISEISIRNTICVMPTGIGDTPDGLYTTSDGSDVWESVTSLSSKTGLKELPLEDYLDPI